MRTYQVIVIGAVLAAALAAGAAHEGGTPADTTSIERLDLSGAVGADVNAVDRRGLPLLQQAMRRQDRKAFRLLLELGADPARGSRDGQTAMHLAAMGNDQFWLEQLLRRGVGPDLPNTITGAPPLFDALRARLPRNVDRLLAAGARLDTRDRNGTTPLH